MSNSAVFNFLKQLKIAKQRKKKWDFGLLSLSAMRVSVGRRHLCPPEVSTIHLAS